MNYVLDIAPEFEDDVFSVTSYIDLNYFNPSVSERLSEKINKTLIHIADNPLLYPLYHDDELADKGFRYAVVSRWLIFYTVDENNRIVRIYRFINGAQDIQNIL